MSDHRIFSKDVIEIGTKGVVQKVKYNREELLSKETATNLNTYLNFGIFPTFTDTSIDEYEEKDGKLVLKEKGVGTPGVRSIFNRAGTVILGSIDGRYDIDLTDGAQANSWRISNNVPLIDSPKARQRIRKFSGCSVRELVEASSNGWLGQETYSYSDFMYCKHLGKVSNNYMITLRRFALPVDDFIGAIGDNMEKRLESSAKHEASIGCMVTWMGVSGNDLSSLLTYSYSMPFRFEDADEQDKQMNADETTSPLNGIFSMFDETYRQQYQDGYADAAANSAFEYFGISSGQAPYKNHAKFRDSRKVYGPIDSIRSTYIRDDKGLTFNQTLKLVFEYELRAYNGINARQAMLDLLSNILNVTYTTGSFWGGGYKGFAAHQSNIFANLNIFKARGGFTNFIDAFSKDLSTLGSGIKQNVENNGGIWETIKGLANNIGGMIMSGMLNKLGRPQKAMYNTLLSPAPIGFWHVTIGNPKHPIMSIGNMIITNVTIEHNGPLGLDDFPTGLKVTVDLDRGKPRDLRDIEKLYMQGTDRIYSSMSDKVFDMYKNAELYQSHKKEGALDQYEPVADIATIEEPAENKKDVTITVQDYENLKGKLKKYFGTDDAYAIYVPAAEQEYGAGKKKPSTAANDNITGERNGK